MTAMVSKHPAFKPHWGYIGWFTFLHIMVLASVIYASATYREGVRLGPIESSFAWSTLGLAFLLWLYCHLSITCGVHRFFTHSAYKAKPWLQWVWLVGFSAVFQAPARWWVGKHQRHHDEADTPTDPHWIGRGLWWAHVMWNCDREAMRPEPRKYTEHLRRDSLLWKRIKWQQSYYYPLGIGVGIVLPTIICWIGWSDPLGGMLIGGFSRLVYQYHTTWITNSQAHMFGTRPFKGGTATAHRWIGLFFNLGESTDHSYHHRFPWDWRIEPIISWFNPGTWFLWFCAKCGWIWDEKEASPERIKQARQISSTGIA